MSFSMIEINNGNEWGGGRHKEKTKKGHFGAKKQKVSEGQGNQCDHVKQMTLAIKTKKRGKRREKKKKQRRVTWAGSVGITQ